MTDAEYFRAQQRPQFQFDPRREGEGAFRSDKQMREIVHRARCQCVEIVTADAALDVRISCGDLVCFAFAQRQHVAKQVATGLLGVLPSGIARYVAEMKHCAVGKGRIHRNRIVAHRAVSERTPAAGIVARHATDGSARGGRYIDRKPQPVFIELPVEIVEHDAGLDHAGALLHVDRDQPVQIF